MIFKKKDKYFSPKSRIFSFAILVFIILQIAFIIKYDNVIDGDEIGYINISQNICKHGTISMNGNDPTAFRTPGYPAFVCSTSILGGSYYTIYIIQALALLVTAFITYLLYRNIFGEDGSHIVFLLVLFSPPLFFYTHHIITEILFTLFGVLSIYILQKAINKRSKWLFFLAGATTGIMCLIRPTSFYFIIIASILALVLALIIKNTKIKEKQGDKRKKENTVTYILLIILGFSIIYTPWIIRNTYVFDDPITTSTVNGLMMYMGFHKTQEGHFLYGNYTFINPTPEMIYLDSISKNEVERQSNFQKATIKLIKEEPADAFVQYIRNIKYLMFRPDLYEQTMLKTLNGPAGAAVKIGANIYLIIYWIWLILFLLFVCMLVHTFKESKIYDNKYILSAITAAYIMYFILAHGIIEAVPRYFIPMFPFVIILAVAYIYSKPKRRNYIQHLFLSIQTIGNRIINLAIYVLKDLKNIPVYLKIARFMASGKNCKTLHIGTTFISGPNKSTVALRYIENVIEYKDLFKDIKLEKGAIILDIGSNIGTSSMYLSKRYPDAKILAFDPVKEVNRYFKENMRLNKVRNIKLYEFGLSNQSRTATIYIEPRRWNMNSLNPLFDGYIKQKVQIKKTEEFFRKQKIDSIGLLKIDIEGSEKDLMNDILRTDYINRIKYIYIEVREDNIDLLETLDKYFDVIHISKEYLPRDRSYIFNYLGIRKSRRKQGSSYGK